MRNKERSGSSFWLAKDSEGRASLPTSHVAFLMRLGKEGEGGGPHCAARPDEAVSSVLETSPALTELGCYSRAWLFLKKFSADRSSGRIYRCLLARNKSFDYLDYLPLGGNHFPVSQEGRQDN